MIFKDTVWVFIIKMSLSLLTPSSPQLCYVSMTHFAAASLITESPLLLSSYANSLALFVEIVKKEFLVQ